MVLEDKVITKENLKGIAIWVLLILVYSLFLWDKVTLHYILVISFLMTSWVGSIFDIKDKTGNKRFYCYSENKNQKLRILVFFALSLLVFFGHKLLLCNQLNLFSCN